jgi:hypothetical protein
MNARALSILALAFALSFVYPPPSRAGEFVGAKIAATPQQPASRPVSAELSGTAVVSGHVTDEAGMPLEGVRVRTQPRDRFRTRSTVTDSQGRYELRGLPKMSLRLAAFLPGYSGMKEGFEALRLVTLRDGEVRTVDLVLVRVGSIAGHVLVAGGEPLIGAMVRAVPRRQMPATDRPTSTPDFGTTGDQGVYRLSGLPPGDYYLAVRPMTGGAPRTAQAGRGLPPVFYAGVPDSGSARCVTVAPGTETAADITVPLLPLFTVTGSVLDRDGRPTSLALLELRPRQPPELESIVVTRAASPDPGGTFWLSGVAAGTYTLAARETPVAPPTGQGPPTPRARREVEIDVRSDVSGLELRLTDGATARGRVVFASRPPENVASLQIYYRPKTMTRPGWMRPPVMLTADGAFEFKGLRGVVEFMVMYAPAAGPNSRAALAARLGPKAGASVQSPTDEPGGPVYRKVAGVPIPIVWRVRALRLRGRDVTNEGVDVGQDGTISRIVVEVSADQPLVTGIVRDDQGQPYAGATMVAIATDPRAASTPEGMLWPRGLSMQDGRYFMIGLPPGTWDLVALADPVLIDNDAESLAQLRHRATRVTLRGSQSLRLDLRVVKVR